ncbi:hypothetical protein WME79_38225 [Sorangium sp. So ce726]
MSDNAARALDASTRTVRIATAGASEDPKKMKLPPRPKNEKKMTKDP